MTRFAAILAVATTASGGVAAADVTRTQAIDQAKDYVYYPWRAGSANLQASCTTSYSSAYTVGDFLGVAYNWGGFDSLFQFSQKIANGYGAGTPAGGAILSCTTGVDCSGFVSRTWKTTSKYSTSSLPQISTVIPVADMLAGDIFNKPADHVAMFDHLMASGAPFMYEAFPPQARVNAFGGWSWVDGFVPRRYTAITGTSVADPVGTLTNPIVIGSLPYSSSGDTSSAPNNVLDGCAVAPSVNESGPELVYRVDITTPGQLTVSVSDDAGVDIDVHLLTSFNTSDCIARADTTFTHAVDCGTYYIVADTYAGAANAGPFTLTVSETASGSACGSGPPSYDLEGKLGDACAYPQNTDLPPCNPTLDGDVCVYTAGPGAQSFCTKACATDNDCAGMPGGAGCCQDLGNNEHYCVLASLCPGAPGDPGLDAGPDASNPTGDAGVTPSGDASSGGNAEVNSGHAGCGVASDAGMLDWLGIAVLGLLARRRRRQLSQAR